MVNDYVLKVEQTQKLNITIDMIQAIKLLEFSSQELNDFIREQILTNPVIDDTEFNYNGRENDQYEGNRCGKENHFFEGSYKREETLRETLMLQLEMQVADERIKAAAISIIDNLDDNGYLTQSIDEMVEESQADRDIFDKAVDLVRSFEPDGVACENIMECLNQQLINRNRWTIEKSQIINLHLQDIALRKLNLIAESMEMPLNEIISIVDEIKSLNPKPGKEYRIDEPTRYIIPDVFLENDDKEFKVVLNSNRCFNVSINKEYIDMLSKGNIDEETASYIRQKAHEAKWLINSIQQCNRTIMEVAQAIVVYQRTFFIYGEEYLKPMKLSDIAEALDIHVSTVSRAINGKFIQTQSGTFELRDFLSNGYEDCYGNKVSSIYIKRIIKTAIQGEKRDKPLTDKELSEILMTKGINVARRTVAKYRESLCIPNSHQRKNIGL